MSSVIFPTFITVNLMFFYRQLPDDLLVKVKEAINSADNLTIAPSFAVEGVSTIIFFKFYLLSFHCTRNVKW